MISISSCAGFNSLDIGVSTTPPDNTEPITVLKYASIVGSSPAASAIDTALFLEVDLRLSAWNMRAAGGSVPSGSTTTAEPEPDPDPDPALGTSSAMPSLALTNGAKSSEAPGWTKGTWPRLPLVTTRP